MGFPAAAVAAESPVAFRAVAAAVVVDSPVVVAFPEEGKPAVDGAAAAAAVV